MVSHAANPTAVQLNEDIYRIFFSTRDELNRSSVSAIDLNVATLKVVNNLERPLLTPGPVGSFYSHGYSLGNAYEISGESYIGFMGWHVPQGEHWRGEIGALRLTKDFQLEVCSKSPILGLSSEDPISLSYPWVYKTENNAYKMWYGSTVTWDAGNGEMLHVLKQASSIDGRNWKPTGIKLPYCLGIAQAFSGPTLFTDKYSCNWLWFSYRGGLGTKYRIGSAYSENGTNWTPNFSTPAIEPSGSGWESEMVEYPFVFSHKGRTYMLYNGDGYGKTGIGIAELHAD